MPGIFMTCWAMCGKPSKTGRPTTTTPRWRKLPSIPKGLRAVGVAVAEAVVEVDSVEAAVVEQVVPAVVLPVEQMQQAVLRMEQLLPQQADLPVEQVGPVVVLRAEQVEQAALVEEVAVRPMVTAHPEVTMLRSEEHTSE